MNWLKNLLDETMYKFYLENNPDMVISIKQLLIRGEKPKIIKKHCESIVGKSITSSCVSHMIDYVNKQIKN
jgi:hypothetical protein